MSSKKSLKYNDSNQVIEIQDSVATALAVKESDASSFRPSLLEIPFREETNISHLNISSSSSNESPFEYSVGSDGDHPQISPISNNDRNYCNEEEKAIPTKLLDMYNDKVSGLAMRENEVFLTPQPTLKAGVDVMEFASRKTVHDAFDGKDMTGKFTTSRYNSHLMKGDNCSLLNKRNMRGESALTITASKCLVSGIIMLLDNGSDINIEDSSGKTPLLLACENFKATGHHESVATLLQYNPNVNHQDQRGKTALHIAAEHESIDCVAALLDMGCCANIVDKDGNSALHYAAISGSIPMIEIFLAKRCAADCAFCRLESEECDLDSSSVSKLHNNTGDKKMIQNPAHPCQEDIHQDGIHDRHLEIWDRFFQNACNAANDREDDELSISFDGEANSRLMNAIGNEGPLSEVIEEASEHEFIPDQRSGLHKRDNITVLDIFLEILSWPLRFFFPVWLNNEEPSEPNYSYNPRNKYYVEKMEPPDDLKKALKMAGLNSS